MQLIFVTNKSCYKKIVINFQQKVSRGQRWGDLFLISNFLYLAFNVGSAWSFVFFIPATTANDPRLQRNSIPDFIHYIYFHILILQKETVFPFLMLSAKQGHYWYHLCYDAVLDWKIEPGTSHTRSQHYTTRLSVL